MSHESKCFRSQSALCQAEPWIPPDSGVQAQCLGFFLHGSNNGVCVKCCTCRYSTQVKKVKLHIDRWWRTDKGTVRGAEYHPGNGHGCCRQDGGAPGIVGKGGRRERLEKTSQRISSWKNGK